MKTLPPDLQELLARCLDSGAAADWQELHSKLADERVHPDLLEAYAETCALHHDLRCILNGGANDDAFLRGVESALDGDRKNSGRFVLDVTSRAHEGLLKQAKTQRRPNLLRIAAVAAAAIVLLVAGAYMLRGPAQSAVIGRLVHATPDLKLTRGSTVRAAAAGESLLADDLLQNGTSGDVAEVELDERATLKLATGARAGFPANKAYSVELTQGLLSASVGPHAKDHPFVVHTPNADAEVLGTRFSLDVTAAGTRLNVYESRVRLRRDADPTGIVVEAGFAAEARPGTQLVAVPIPVDLAATFQNGRDGYSGTREANITTQNAEFTNGNGKTQFEGDDQLLCNFKEYECRFLIRFEGLSLPANAKVESAQLEIDLENWSATNSLQGAYLNVPWNLKAREMDGLGWLHRDDGVDWSAPGAGDANKDRIPGAAPKIPTLGEANEVRIRIPLDASIVQRWIETPASNSGVIFWLAHRGDQLRFHTTDAPEQNRRPSLVIHYSVPAGTPVPDAHRNQF